VAEFSLSSVATVGKSGVRRVSPQIHVDRERERKKDRERERRIEREKESRRPCIIH